MPKQSPGFCGFGSSFRGDIDSSEFAVVTVLTASTTGSKIELSGGSYVVTRFYGRPPEARSWNV